MTTPSDKNVTDEVNGRASAVAPGSASAALADKIVTAIEGRFREWLMSGEHAEAKQLVAELIAREYIGGFPPGAQVLKARAYKTDETFGHDRWVADQYSCGRGTRDALIVLLPNDTYQPTPGNGAAKQGEHTNGK